MIVCYSSSKKRIQSASEEIYNFPVPVGLWVPPDAWTEWKEENLTWSQAWKLLISTSSPKIKGRALTRTPPQALQQHTHSFFLSASLTHTNTHTSTHTHACTLEEMTERTYVSVDFNGWMPPLCRCCPDSERRCGKGKTQTPNLSCTLSALDIFCQK